MLKLSLTYRPEQWTQEQIDGHTKAKARMKEWGCTVPATHEDTVNIDLMLPDEVTFREVYDFLSLFEEVVDTTATLKIGTFHHFSIYVREKHILLIKKIVEVSGTTVHYKVMDTRGRSEYSSYTTKYKKTEEEIINKYSLRKKRDTPYT